MDYKEAIKIIEKKYKVNAIDDVLTEIYVDKLLNPFNFYFLCLVNCKTRVIISDLANTADIFYDKDEEYFKNMCEKYNIAFNNWHIERTFTNMFDLEEFIYLLDEISEDNADKY